MVDGFNLLHAVLLRGKERAQWWSVANQGRVVRLLEEYTKAEVWVVFDAARPGSERFAGEAAVPVLFAPNADQRIIEIVAEYAKRRQVFVVTADRALADRARSRGGRRISPWQFVAAFEQPAR